MISVIRKNQVLSFGSAGYDRTSKVQTHKQETGKGKRISGPQVIITVMIEAVLHVFMLELHPVVLEDEDE